MLCGTVLTWRVHFFGYANFLDWEMFVRNWRKTWKKQFGIITQIDTSLYYTVMGKILKPKLPSFTLPYLSIYAIRVFIQVIED